MDLDDEPVEELLVLRVVDEARRRRVRRAVAAGLLAIVTAGGMAVAFTHRTGVRPTAASSGVVHPGTMQAADESADRTAIYEAARDRYLTTGRLGPRGSMEFGTLRLDGSTAYLEVSFRCGPMCGHGEELILHRLNGVWDVVGVRTSWVS